MKKVRKHFIKRLFLYTFSSTAILMIIGSLFIFNINQSYSKQIKYLTNNNQYFTDLIVISTKINLSYEQIDKEMSFEKNILTYKEELKGILDSLSNIVTADADTQMYYRTIINQVTYSDELEDILFSSETSNSKQYSVWKSLRTAYTLLTYQCNYMLENYIAYSTAEFAVLEQEHTVEERNLYIILGVIASLNYLYIGLGILKVLKQLNIFQDHAQKLSDGKWDTEDIKNCAYEELDVVGSTFNSMKQNIKLYITDIEKNIVLEKQLNLLKQSQLKSLQQQMNPHFLYNTLNIISRLAMFDGNEKIVHLMESTALILRYNMDNLTRLVPLRKEVEIIMAYIEIQQTRFHERIQFKINIESDFLLDRYKTSPMIIQPLVENSIKHGFQNLSAGGLLKINIFEQDGCCNITVWDNGKGIPSSEIEEIFHKENSIGLSNVRERLSLCFPGMNSIHVSSCKEKWTKITISLPFV